MTVIVNQTLDQVTVNAIGDVLVAADTPFVKMTYSAAGNPTVDNDASDGFVVGSQWVNTSTDDHYFCADNTNGAAVWTKMDTSAGDAPSDASYLTLGLHAGLSDERVFTVGNGLDAVDDGADSTYTVSVDESELDLDAMGGILGIDQGGTGEITQTLAFNALSPLTTKGDVIVHDGIDNIRVAVGNDGQLLSADSGEASGVKWVTSAGISSISDITDATGDNSINLVGNIITFPYEYQAYQVVNVGGAITGGSATGLANDATVYTADVDVDGGGNQPIAVTGSAAQTYTALINELNADTTGATWALVNGNLQCTSDNTTTSASISITDTDLFSSLTDFVSIASAVQQSGQLVVKDPDTSKIVIGSQDSQLAPDRLLTVYDSFSNQRLTIDKSGELRAGNLYATYADDATATLGFANNREAFTTFKRGHYVLGATSNQVSWSWDGAGIGHIQGWVFQNGGQAFRPNFAWVIGRARTTNNTQTELGYNGADGDEDDTPTTKLGQGTNTYRYYECTVIAKRESSTDYSVWTLTFVATQGANAASMAVTAVTATQIAHSNGAAWVVTADADTTNGRPRINVTGENAKNIRWQASCKITSLA